MNDTSLSQSEKLSAMATVTEATKRLRISRKTAIQWATEAGALHRYGVRSYRIDADKLNAWIQQQDT